MRTEKRFSSSDVSLLAAALVDGQSGEVRWKSDGFDALAGRAGSPDKSAAAKANPPSARQWDVHVRRVIEQAATSASPVESMVPTGKDNGVPAPLRRIVAVPVHPRDGSADVLVQWFSVSDPARAGATAEPKGRVSFSTLGQVLQSLPVALYTCDELGRITHFNRSAQELWGRAPMLGHDQWCGSWRIFRPDGSPLPLEECPLAVALRERRPVRGVEIVVERPDGTRRNVLPHPDPLFDDAGRLVGAINMLVDITQRKTDELELVRTNRELRRRNDELAQFIHTISHDMKSPLVTTMGFIGMIREDLAAGRTEGLESSFQHIEKAMVRMDALIEDLLNLGRAGHADLHLEMVDVRELVTELTRQFDEPLRQANASIRVASVPSLQADRSQLKLVLDNLISNAIQYGGRESLKIVVGGAIVDDEIRLFVQDNGIGIASQYHKKIFELFQRLDTSHAGTGAGLAIVSRVMELHGGRAWVESMPGHGATFWLAFPRHPVD